ncbi:MAG: RluA family pseudouridine synthase [Candidatus Zixiibacteriota bacterium]
MIDDTEHDGRRVTLVVPDASKGCRLDHFLASSDDLGLSRSRIHKLICEQHVLVDGRTVPKNHTLRGGEAVVVVVPLAKASLIEGEDIPLSIVYEDDYLLVVDKAAGMVTHPAAGHRTGTLVNALLGRFNKLSLAGGLERAGIVHRLDKNTSGLLVVAKTDNAQIMLQKALSNREIKRIYTALVWGHMADDQGSIDAPIGRSLRNRKKMAVTTVHSREAFTSYKVMERYRFCDLLEVQLGTGRTHQIRVHLSHLNHPVLGDPEYGGRQKRLKGIFGPDRPLAAKALAMIDRQALHAARLEFVHPVEGNLCTHSSILPDDIRRVIESLRDSADQ